MSWPLSLSSCVTFSLSSLVSAPQDGPRPVSRAAGLPGIGAPRTGRRRPLLGVEKTPSRATWPGTGPAGARGRAGRRGPICKRGRDLRGGAVIRPALPGPGKEKRSRFPRGVGMQVFLQHRWASGDWLCPRHDHLRLGTHGVPRKQPGPEPVRCVASRLLVRPT